MSQLTFDTAQLTADSEIFAAYPPKVVEKFLNFHQKHPEVYDSFADHAKRVFRAGHNKYSARTIFEVIRWESDLQSSDGAFKINGDYVPLYSRMLMQQRPELEGFFETRQVRSLGIGSIYEYEQRANA